MFPLWKERQCSSIIKSYLGHFPAQTQKAEKILPKKKSIYFMKWNFVTVILKRFLYSLKRKLCLYFLNRTFYLYFRKWNPALFSQRLKKFFFLYFRKRTPLLPPNQKIYIYIYFIFWEIELLSLKLKIFLILQEGISLYFLKKSFYT